MEIIDPMNLERFLSLGKIYWLWSASELHREWEVGLSTRVILPAVATGQYKIVENSGCPVAYCCWAFLDIEAETRYLANPNSLEPKDWKSGDRLWFVDWISPYSTKHTWDLKHQMAEKFPNHLARSIRVYKGSSKGRVAFYAGKNLSQKQAFDLREQYFLEVAGVLRR